MLNLNQRAAVLVDELVSDAESLRIAGQQLPSGARVVDCGVRELGGIEAGRRLAEICLAGLGTVAITCTSAPLPPGPAVCVRSDQPVAACMASQYAGWQIAVGKFFAMGSGPMRAAAGREALFDRIGLREQGSSAVGVLETSRLPGDDVATYLAKQCNLHPSALTLLAARTASLAGTIQVVARSLETALHKLDEIGFDLARVVSGFGCAPLPPVAANDLAAIGLTNDAILYGGEVTLWVTGDDDTLAEIGPRVPSSASPEHGQPFARIFERAGGDFYKIDPHLFSPAVVSFWNVETGRSHRFGKLAPDVLER